MARAWDLRHHPFIVAPAMNTLMWEHPFTNKQLQQLESELGVYIVQPISKVLACGDVGNGGTSHHGIALENLIYII